MGNGIQRAAAGEPPSRKEGADGGEMKSACVHWLRGGLRAPRKSVQH